MVCTPGTRCTTQTGAAERERSDDVLFLFFCAFISRPIRFRIFFLCPFCWIFHIRLFSGWINFNLNSKTSSNICAFYFLWIFYVGELSTYQICLKWLGIIFSWRNVSTWSYTIDRIFIVGVAGSRRAPPTSNLPSARGAPQPRSQARSEL